MASVLHQWLPAAGLMLVLGSLVTFDEESRHPSLLTLVPVIGTAILIRFATGDDLITRLLRWRPLVAVGLVSYSYYLWHFPVLVFQRIAFDQVSALEKIAAVIASLALAWASYWVVERPARNRRSVRFARVGTLCSIGVFALVFASVFMLATEGARFRYASFEQLVDVDYWIPEKGNREFFRITQNCWIDKGRAASADPFGECRAGSGTRERPTIMLVGDSHLAGLIPGLVNQYGKEHIIQRNIDGCIPLFGVNWHASKVHCKTVNDIYAEIPALMPDLIIIGGSWSGGVELNAMLQLLKGPLASFKDRILLMGPLPRWPRPLPDMLKDAYVHGSGIPDRLPPVPGIFELDKAFAQVAQLSGVGYISPVQSLCMQGKCLTRVENRPDAISSFDYAHLTVAASKRVIEDHLQLIESRMSH